MRDENRKDFHELHGVTDSASVGPMPDTTTALPWSDGPARGNNPVTHGEVLVGDRFLVLVAVRTRGVYGLSWEAHVIVATEDGWDDADGDSWGAWGWDDVEYFIRLDNKGYLPPLPN